MCSLTTCQPIYQLQPFDILFGSWCSGIIITVVRTLSLDQKGVIEGIFLREQFLNYHFSPWDRDTLWLWVHCACERFSVRPQYRQQQPVAKASTKVIAVREKGRHCIQQQPKVYFHVMTECKHAGNIIASRVKKKHPDPSNAKKKWFFYCGNCLCGQLRKTRNCFKQQKL